MVDSIIQASTSGGDAKHSLLAMLRNRFTPIQYRFITFFWPQKLSDMTILEGAAFAGRLAVLGTAMAGQVQQAKLRRKAFDASNTARDSGKGPQASGEVEKSGWQQVERSFLAPDGETLKEDPYPLRRPLRAEELAPLPPGEHESEESSDVSFEGFAAVRMSSLSKDHQLVLRWVVGYEYTAPTKKQKEDKPKAPAKPTGDRPTEPAADAAQGVKDTYTTDNAPWVTYDAAHAEYLKKLTAWNNIYDPLLWHEDDQLRIERNVGTEVVAKGDQPSDFSMDENQLLDAWVNMGLDWPGVETAFQAQLTTKQKIDDLKKDHPALHIWLSALDYVDHSDQAEVWLQAGELRLWNAGGEEVHGVPAMKTAYSDFAISELEGITAPQQVSEMFDATLQAIVKETALNGGGKPQDSDWISWKGGRLELRAKGQRTYTMDELLTGTQSAVDAQDLTQIGGTESVSTAAIEELKKLTTATEPKNIANDEAQEVVVGLTPESSSQLTAQASFSAGSLAADFQHSGETLRTRTWDSAALDTALGKVLTADMKADAKARVLNTTAYDPTSLSQEAAITLFQQTFEAASPTSTIPTFRGESDGVLAEYKDGDAVIYSHMWTEGKLDAALAGITNSTDRADAKGSLTSTTAYAASSLGSDAKSALDQLLSQTADTKRAVQAEGNLYELAFAASGAANVKSVATSAVDTAVQSGTPWLAALKNTTTFNSNTLSGIAQKVWKALPKADSNQSFQWLTQDSSGTALGTTGLLRLDPGRLDFWPETSLRNASFVAAHPATRLFKSVQNGGSSYVYSDLTDEQWKLVLQDLGSVEANDVFQWSPDKHPDKLVRTRLVAGQSGGGEKAEFDIESVKKACAAIVLSQPALDYLKTVTSPTRIADLQDAFAAETIKTLGTGGGGADVSGVAMSDTDVVHWTGDGLVVNATPRIAETHAVAAAALAAKLNSTDAKTRFETAAAGLYEKQKTLSTPTIDYWELTGRTLQQKDLEDSDDPYWTANLAWKLAGKGARWVRWSGGTAADPLQGEKATFITSGPPEVYKRSEWSKTTVKVQCRWVPSVAGALPDGKKKDNSVVSDLLDIGGTSEQVRNLNPQLGKIILQLNDPDMPGISLLGSDRVKVDGAKLVRDQSFRAEYYDLPEVVKIQRSIVKKVTAEPRYLSGIDGSAMTTAAMADRGLFDEAMRAFAEFASVEYGGYDVGTYDFREINNPVGNSCFETLDYQNLTFRTGFMNQYFLSNWCRDMDYGKVMKRDGIIIMMDRGGLPVRTIGFSGALPVSWTGATLDAYGDEQPIDELVIACDEVVIRSSFI